MKKKELLCPSWVTLEIREASGDDDDLYSGGNAKDYELLNSYLAAIITRGPNGEKNITPEQVSMFPLRDKYFILIASRVFSLSGSLIFSYEWVKDQPTQEYVIDLNDFIWDYEKPFPKRGEESFDSQRIQPYPKPYPQWTEVELDGRKVRFSFLDGVGEGYLLEMPEPQRSINKQLLARNLQIFEANAWHKVKNFQTFSSRDMVKIRQAVSEADPETQGLITITNPSTGEDQTLSLLGISDFFFPTKI